MKSAFKKTRKNLKHSTLDKVLREVTVIYDWEGKSSNLNGWCAVATDQGIVAYLCNESEAYRYRLDYINRILNG